MHVHTSSASPHYFETVQMVDAEFDRFEINNDFEMVLREAETANFYHDNLNDEE